MNTPLGTNTAGLEERAKIIRGLGFTEVILGMLVAVAAAIDAQFAFRRVLAGNAPSWALLSSPASLHAFHLVWTLFVASILISSHGILCRRLQRPSRPFGFAAGILLTVQFAYLMIAIGFMRWEMDSINATLNGAVVNFGDRFGLFIDVLICIAAALAVSAACFTGFFASQETKRALEGSDQARYALDSIPLSVFPGAVLMVYLSYSYLADLVVPTLTIAGVSLPSAWQRITLVVFAAGCALAAWGLYGRRLWGWWAALAVGVAWALSSYFPASDVSILLSGSTFDKYRNLVTQLTPAVQTYVQMYNVFVLIGLGLFVGYLVFVRRHLTREEPAGHVNSGPEPEVPIYADRQRLVMSHKELLIFGGIALLEFLLQHYGTALIFSALMIINAAVLLVAIFTPRYTFRKEGLAFTGLSRVATPIFPYAAFKTVRLITTPKPPRPMRSIEDEVLNLNVSLFAAEERTRIEDEFKKRDISVTVLAPDAVAS